MIVNYKLYKNKGFKSISNKNIEWVHFSRFGWVPPVHIGSYNHLIWDILNKNPEKHAYVGSYFPESWELAKDLDIPIALIEFKPLSLLQRFLNKVENTFLKLTGKYTAKNRFVEACADTILETNSKNIIQWDFINELKFLRKKLPEHEITYAQRHYDYPVEVSYYDDCDILITQTPGQTRLAFEKNIRLTPFVVTIPNGVELDQFYPLESEEKALLREKLSLPKDRFIIIFPSKLTLYKGVRYLKYWIEHFQNSSHIHFLVVGKLHKSLSEKDKKYLSALLNTTQNVSWYKKVPRKEMYKYYQVADVSLMPGLWREGFSMSAVESLASGLPIIATNSGCYNEILFHKYNGFICRKEHLNADFQEAVNILSKDPALLKQLSQNARYYAEQKLSRKRVVDNFNAFFEKRYEDINNDLSIDR